MKKQFLIFVLAIFTFFFTWVSIMGGEITLLLSLIFALSIFALGLYCIRKKFGPNNKLQKKLIDVWFFLSLGISFLLGLVGSGLLAFFGFPIIFSVLGVIIIIINFFINRRNKIREEVGEKKKLNWILFLPLFWMTSSLTLAWLLSMNRGALWMFSISLPILIIIMGLITWIISKLIERL